MGTYTPDQYQRVWRKRASELKKAAQRTAKDAAIFMRNTARGMAPVKTGDLRQLISNPVNKGNNVYEVSSSVGKGFPYNLWVNQTAPFRTIHPYWAKGNGVVYGDGTHRNTGTPRFWHFATLRTQALLGKVARKNVQKALKVSVG